MTINCLIVDDEPLARQLIRDYLESMTEFNIIAECGNAIETLQALEQHKIDVLFLDINMPKLTGLQLKKQIDDTILTVFTTAYEEHAVAAFEVEAFDYLIKPISFDRFLTAANRVKKQFEKTKTKEKLSITIKENKRIYKIDLDEIFYLQAYGDYVRVFAKSKTYITKERLSTIAKELSDEFFKVHRSYIINIQSIQYIEGNFVVINDEQIPISQSLKGELLKRI